MDSIQIGKKIAQSRKQKAITQEELANYLGVSKPAVSKWESGQSYPDILLLPVLASYFNITVDELLSYEPQMEKEEVRKLYQRLAGDFAKKPFEQVYEECERYIKKYFSCWYLQYKVALLYVNHSSLAGTQKQMEEILFRAIEIFERVSVSCEDVTLAKQSLQLKALCYLSLQQPQEAVDILEGLCEQQLQPETLLIKAYQMLGDKKKAMAYLHGTVFINLSNLLGRVTDFLMMYADQPDKADHYYKIFMKLCELFEIEQLEPSILYNIYYTAAYVFLMQDRKQEALDELEKYVNLVVKSNRGEFILHGNQLLDELEEYMTLIDAEITAPRSSEVIWRDIKNIMLQNPVFAALEEEPRFQQLKKRLEE